MPPLSGAVVCEATSLRWWMGAVLADQVDPLYGVLGPRRICGAASRRRRAARWSSAGERAGWESSQDAFRMISSIWSRWISGIRPVLDLAGFEMVFQDRPIPLPERFIDTEPSSNTLHCFSVRTG